MGMSQKHYVPLATIVGRTLSLARWHGGEEGRTQVYGVLYEPLVKLMQEDNEHFDQTRFAYAVSVAEQANS